MEVPAWFRNAMQQRLDEVAARSDTDPELQQARTEEQKAFASLYGGMDTAQYAARGRTDERPRQFGRGMIRARQLQVPACSSN